MNVKKTFFQTFFLPALIAGVSITFSACDDNDETGGGFVEVPADGFFISVTGQALGATAAEYIIMADAIDEGEMAISDNLVELESSGYTWIFNTDPSAAIGLIYKQGDPGLCLGYGINSNGMLQEKGEFIISTRFTSYGFFENYAITSVGGQVVVDENENPLTYEDGTEREDGVVFNLIDLDNNFARSIKSVETYNITGNGEQATFSGIVDMGNGEFLTGLVVSQARDDDATGGASSGTITYPDSVWVAAYDKDLNLKRIYRDDRISYSAGRYRSQYYSQIGRTNDGTVYVFSGSYDYNANATSKKAGALKINRNATTFDSDYYFDIETLSGGYRFRKIWYIAQDYFMIELYNAPGRVKTIDDPATQYGIVNMKDKTFNLVKGLPAKDKMESTGQPMAYFGKMYFPAKEEGKDAAIYVIDPETGIAETGLVITGATAIRAVGKLVKD